MELNLDILNEKSKFLSTLGFVGFCIFMPLFVFIIPVFIAMPFLILNENNTINNIALNYGFGKRDLNDYGLNEYIYKKKENNNSKDEELVNNYKQLFEDILYYIGPIQCFLKAKEFFLQLVDLLTELNNRNEEEWNKFHVEKI